MIEMTFSKHEVVIKLIQNLAEHKIIFAEAVDGYLIEARKQLELEVARLKVKKGESPINIFVSIQAPENHEADYRAVLSMLKASTDEEVVFDSDQYRCYMLDEWDWQRSFLHSNACYSMTATEKLAGRP